MRRVVATLVAGMLGPVLVPAGARAAITTTPLPSASAVVGTTLSDSVTVSGLTAAIRATAP